MPVIATDLDGTLITCEQRQCTVLRAVLARFGVEGVDLASVWNAKRNGATTRHALTQVGCCDAVVSRVCATWSEEIECFAWLALDTVFTDTYEALSLLTARGFAIVVLTARQNRSHAIMQVRALGLLRHVLTVEVVNPGHAIACKASVLQRLSPTAFIGDTETDCISAREAGIPFVGIGRGQRTPECLLRHGVPVVAADLISAAHLIANGAGLLRTV